MTFLLIVAITKSIIDHNYFLVKTQKKILKIENLGQPGIDPAINFLSNQENGRNKFLKNPNFWIAKSISE